MPLKPDRLERSLKLATTARELCEKELESKKVSGDDLKKNTKWRSLNAACEKIQGRIDAAKALEAINKESSDSGEE